VGSSSRDIRLTGFVHGFRQSDHRRGDMSGVVSAVHVSPAAAVGFKRGGMVIRRRSGFPPRHPQWINVDLGAVTNVGRVRLTWDAELRAQQSDTHFK